MSQQKVKTDILEALYTINKIAKNYSEESQDAYQQGFKKQAKILSIQKSALYDYKSHILERLYPQAEKIKQHTIHGDPFYCFYFENYSFHSPAEEFEKINPEQEAEENITESFESDSTPQDELPMSERKALKTLQSEFGSANQFVHPKILSTGYSYRSMCWSYLNQYVEEGTTVSESAFQEQQKESAIPEQYQFKKGDVFQTVEHGQVQILDRYGCWTDQAMPTQHESVRCRPVYDILINGEERKECVQQERITRDWWISLGDTTNASHVTRISGNAYHEYTLEILSNVPHLEEGDELVFDNGDKAIIDSIYTNDLVLVFFIIDWDHEDWNDHFTADEFLQYVTKIERVNDEIQIDWTHGS
jgi:hypothetical protein